MNPQPVIAAFAPGPWGWPDFAGSPRYHLWELAARGWEVIYFEPPRNLFAPFHEWFADDRPFRAVTLPKLIPFGISGSNKALVLNAARRIASARWHQKAQQYLLRNNIKPSVYWFGAPWHALIADRVRNNAIRVNHVYDELCESPIYGPTQRKLLGAWEEQLILSCDACFCSSVPQLERRQYAAQHTEMMLLQNAVSESYFAPSDEDCPREIIERIRAIPHPRVVYGGVADLRLDGELLAHVVEQMPDAHLVFLGTRAASLDPTFARIASHHPRVHFFGPLPYRAYPALFAEADALIIAHKRIPFTEAMYPEKLNEYLTSGKPVVSVALSEVARLASESDNPRAIRIAQDAHEFVRQLREALDDRDHASAESRIQIARQHTWSIEADKLDTKLRELVTKKSKRD